MIENGWVSCLLGAFWCFGAKIWAWKGVEMRKNDKMLRIKLKFYVKN